MCECYLVIGLARSKETGRDFRGGSMLLVYWHRGHGQEGSKTSFVHTL